MENNVLPAGWVWTRLGEIIYPSNEKAEPLKIEKMPYVGLEHIEKDTGKLLGHGDSSEVKSTKTLFHSGDLLYGKLRPYLNKVFVVDFDGVCSTDILVFSKYSYIYNKFIANRLLCNDFVRYASQNVSGVQHPRVNFNTLSQFPIPLPPLPEQRVIVSKIEQLFSDLDNGIENFKKAQAQLKLYRHSVLKAACEGKLVPTEAELARVEGRDYEAADVLLARIKEERKSNTRGKYIEMPTLDISDLHHLPEGWLWIQAQDVCNWITNGYTPKANKMFQGKGEIPFIKVYNLTNKGELNFNINPTFISKETHTKELSRSNVFPGDILMNIVGPPLGKVSIVPDIFPEWSINQAIVIYRPLKGYDRKFILYSLLTNNILSWAIKRSKATAGQFNLTITICRNLPLPLPPLAEQRRIVAEVERRLSVSDKMEETITGSLQKAESLRQSILKKAFEGKLLNKKELEKVRNAPDWEPAEKLLERIKTEKVKKQKNTHRSGE